MFSSAQVFDYTKEDWQDWRSVKDMQRRKKGFGGHNWSRRFRLGKILVHLGRNCELFSGLLKVAGGLLYKKVQDRVTSSNERFMYPEFNTTYVSHKEFHHRLSFPLAWM